MKVSHTWLQTFFDEPLPSADACEELLTFHAFEVEDVISIANDTVIDIDVLPNRSSDCLSHRGIARELSTILDSIMKRDPLRDPLPVYTRPDKFSVVVDDVTLCPRYIGAIIHGVHVTESPAWLRQSLERLGQRSVNNIVDATNYVMLELGQPLHAFDYAKLTPRDDSSTCIRVRSAQPGETITLLGGEERTFDASHLLITDGVSNTALAVAGVKGGTHAEITPDSTEIIIESANFHPVSVRKTSQALKLSTDASVRFQNEPAIELAAFAMRDVIELIIRIAGGSLGGVYDTWQGPHERMPVDVSLAQINNLLGTSLSQTDVENILMRFGWEFSFDGTEFAITTSWERTDLVTPQDFIEEIGRIHGLRNIVSRIPEPCPSSTTVTKSQYYSDLVRRELTAKGYSEVLTYTLQAQGEVELQNPLASDKAFLRFSLRDGIRKALQDNANQAPVLGLDDVRIFELGTRFTKQREDFSLAVGTLALRTKQTKLDQQLRDDITSLEQILGTSLHGVLEQGIYEASLTQALPDLPEQTTYLQPLPWDSSVRFTPWSNYPFVLRDIAVWVPTGISAEEILAVIIEETPALLIRHDQFDSFEKDGRTSYAWHLVFQASDRTLTDTEITGIMNGVVQALQKRQGWEVR